MDKIQVKFYSRLHFFLKEKLSMKLFEEIDIYNTDRVTIRYDKSSLCLTVIDEWKSMSKSIFYKKAIT